MSFADTLDDLEAMNHVSDDGTVPPPIRRKRLSVRQKLAGWLRVLVPCSSHKPADEKR